MILKRKIAFDILLPVLAVLYVYLSLKFFNWVIDDLYIYFRYVENFISGNGISFNKGEHVEGFSSFLWFIYLSLCGAVNLPLESAAKYTGLAISLMNVILIYRLSSKIIPGRLSLVAPAMMMFSLPYMLWSVSGFELMLYILLILLACIVVLENKSHGGFPLLPFLLFLITITRPEGFLTVIAIFGYMLISTDSGINFKKTAALYIVLLSAFLIFRVIYFGELLPNTYYAKIGHQLIGRYELRSYKNGVFYFIFFLRSNPQFIPGVLFLPVLFFRTPKNKMLKLFALLFLCQLIFIVFAGGDWMVQYRFAVPAIPFLVLLTAGLLNVLQSEYTRLRTGSAVLAVMLCIVTAASLKFNDYDIINRETLLWNNVKSEANAYSRIIKSGETAAAGACGIMPYFMMGVNIIDMVGLTDKEIARYGTRTGTWFERSLPEYVYSKRPQWLIMWKKSNNGGEYLFRNAAPVYHDMSVHPGFQNYELSSTIDVLHDVKVEFYRLKGS